MTNILGLVIASFSIATPSITSTNNYATKLYRNEPFSMVRRYNVNDYVIKDDVNYIFNNKGMIDIFEKQVRYLETLLDDYEEMQSEILLFLKKCYEDINFKQLFDYIMTHTKDENKYLVLSSFLDTDVDIFSNWYVSGLRKCIQSSDAGVKMRATSIYNLYKEYFERI